MRYISTFTNPTFVIGVASEAGNRGTGHHRNRNTDDYAAFEAHASVENGTHANNGSTRDLRIPVGIVAAGVGDRDHQEKASHWTVEAIYQTIVEHEAWPIQRRLVAGLQAANQSLQQQSTGDPTLSKLGATAIAAAIKGDQLYLAYVGDCRAYLVRNGYAHQLTLTSDQADASILASTGFLGNHSMEVATAIVPLDQRPHGTALILPGKAAESLTLNSGDVLLLCTPGLTNAITDQEIARMITDEPAQDAAWGLTDQASQAGAVDSYTALLIQRTQERHSPAVVTRKRPLMRKALLAVVCLLLLVIGWSAIAKEATQFAARMSANLPAALMAAVAQEKPADANLAEGIDPLPDVGQAITLPPPTLVPTPVRVAQGRSLVGQDKLNAVAVTAQESVPAAAAVDQLVTGLNLPTTLQIVQKKIADTLQAAGAAVVSARTATAVAILSAPTPTPTPLPPTPTATATRPLAAQRAARPTATPTPAPNPAESRPDFTKAAVTLLEPVEKDTLRDKRPFRWQANFVPPPGYAFELVFWQAGQDPLRHGKGYAGASTDPQINAGIEHFRLRGAQDGEYRWGILLVVNEPYQRVKYLGGGWVIYVKE